MGSLVNLAKSAVENYVKDGKIIEPPKNFPKEFLKKRAGTFVTIEKNGELRGCIGTYLPLKQNIAEEIIDNAIAAAAKDYRFGPIIEDELSGLSYAVYILSKPVLAKNTKELDAKKYGVIVKTGTKCGLLLPCLDGVDTIEQQISIACKKGGISQEKEKILIYKFTVEKHL